MASTNKAVVEAFIGGETHGRSNNMDIRQGPIKRDGWLIADEGETALVGYGWAVYAVNTGSRIVLYNGWRQWALDKPGQSGHTTVEHMKMVGAAAGPTAITSNRKPQCADPPETAKRMKPAYRL